MRRNAERETGYIKYVRANLRGADLTDRRNSHNLLHMLVADHEGCQDIATQR